MDLMRTVKLEFSSESFYYFLLKISQNLNHIEEKLKTNYFQKQTKYFLNAIKQNPIK
jgi:hypothetical protein